MSLEHPEALPTGQLPMKHPYHMPVTAVQSGLSNFGSLFNFWYAAC